MDESPNAPGESPGVSPDPRWAHLATPANHVRWDLGERADDPTPRERLCLFRIADRTLGVRGDSCRGLEPLDDPTPIPLAPAHVPGLVHVRGRILPVVDLSPFLEVDRRRAPRRNGSEPASALILSLPEGEICLRVDEVLSFAPVATETIVDHRDPLLGSLTPEALIPDSDTSAVPLLDPAAILERLRLGRFQEGGEP